MANAGEIQNQTHAVFAKTSFLLRSSNEAEGLTAQMRLCSGALDEATTGVTLNNRAERFLEGNATDNSSKAAQVDTKIKLLQQSLALNNMKALNRDNTEEVVDQLKVAQESLVDVEKVFAKKKYDRSPKLKSVQNDLDDVADEIGTAVDLIKEGDRDPQTAMQKKRQARRLVTNARKQTRQLSSTIRKRRSRVSSSNEREVLKFMKQGPKIDAIDNRKASRGQLNMRKYNRAQLQALNAIWMSKTNKKVLKQSVR